MKDMLHPKWLDIDSIAELRDSISFLTKFDFSVFDGSGNLILPPVALDPLSAIAKDEYYAFVKRCIGEAVLRKGRLVFEGPMKQHQCFIPARVGDTWLVLVGNSFFASLKDMERFLLAKGTACELSEQELKTLAKMVVLSDMRSIAETCEHGRRLFSRLLGDRHENVLNRERLMRMRTITDLFSEIDRNMSEEKIFDLLCDSTLFLFGGDTVSVMVRRGDAFVPVFGKGRFMEKIESTSLKTEAVFLSDAMKNRSPLVYDEQRELLLMGYPDDISSLSLFPLLLKDDFSVVLGVFNSHLAEDDIDCIFKLCLCAGLMVENIAARKRYMKQVNDLTAVDLASLNPTAFKDPEELYEKIVEVSSRCTNAEKASLMLPVEDSQELLIKAVKGMNKLLAKNITIRAGEGIAGKVYMEGKPWMVADIEKSLSARKRPNYKTGSFVSLPLKIGDETIGVLNLADKRSGEVFSEADMDFLHRLVSHASFAIKGAQYYQLSERMRTLSVTDPLTGLFNRRYFDARLSEELHRALRYDTVLALAIVDVDYFKIFNDTEGHLAGDEVLKAIAKITRESLRSIDVIARFGGDEFIIVMPETDANAAFQVAERLRSTIGAAAKASWKNVPDGKTTISIGISTFPAGGRDPITLIRTADSALYRAKVRGRDKVVVWEADDISGGRLSE